eukprot:56531-Pyramimonas_sp.AAC.1
MGHRVGPRHFVLPPPRPRPGTDPGPGNCAGPASAKLGPGVWVAGEERGTSQNGLATRDGSS